MRGILSGITLSGQSENIRGLGLKERDASQKLRGHQKSSMILAN